MFKSSLSVVKILSVCLIFFVFYACASRPSRPSTPSTPSTPSDTRSSVTNNNTITVQGNVYYFRPSTTPSSPPPTQSSDFLGSGSWYGEDAARAWASIADWVIDHCLVATSAITGVFNERVYISAVHVRREGDRDFQDYSFDSYWKKQVRIDYWVVRSGAQMADGRRSTRWFGF